MKNRGGHESQRESTVNSSRDLDETLVACASEGSWVQQSGGVGCGYGMVKGVVSGGPAGSLTATGLSWGYSTRGVQPP